MTCKRQKAEKRGEFEMKNEKLMRGPSPLGVLAHCTVMAVLMVALGTLCFGQTCEQSTFPQCGGQCSTPGVICRPNSATQHCECPPVPCQQSPFPQCGGQCPAGTVCQAPSGATSCECLPVPCDQSPFPQC